MAECTSPRALRVVISKKNPAKKNPIKSANRKEGKQCGEMRSLKAKWNFSQLVSNHLRKRSDIFLNQNLLFCSTSKNKKGARCCFCSNSYFSLAFCIPQFTTLHQEQHILTSAKEQLKIGVDDCYANVLYFSDGKKHHGRQEKLHPSTIGGSNLMLHLCCNSKADSSYLSLEMEGGRKAIWRSRGRHFSSMATGHDCCSLETKVSRKGIFVDK